MEQWKSKRLEGSSQRGVKRRAKARAKRPQKRRREQRGATLYEALAQFVRYLKDERQASPYTLDAYESDLLRFVGVLEAAGKDLAVTSVTPEDVREHMHALLDRHLAKATVRRALYAMGSFFGWAVRWGLVPQNPVARVTIPRRERVREVLALNRRERAVLTAAADRLAKAGRGALHAHAPTLVRLMLKTGLRKGEVLGLLWRDVDLDAAELFVRYGKGRKSRRVPLADSDLLGRLDRLRQNRGVDRLGNESLLDEAVFANTRHKPIKGSSFYRLFHRLLTEAELSGRGIRPHTLRHTFGSMLCARGVPVPYVKDLLGHEDIGSTMIYVHSTPTALRDAVRKLAE